jgi:hypothetical protein
MFASLTPGMKFITTYGVVEVVDDSRAMPTAELPDDAQQRLKLWRSSRIKVENRRKGNYDSVAVHSLARRK